MLLNQIGGAKSHFGLLSVLEALLSALISFVSLYRTREVAKRQVELQERQVALELESAKLARIQREDLEAATDFPSLSVKIYPVTIYYSDGDLNDTAVELRFENGSALNRSINNCSVGLVDKPSDVFPSGARQAEYQDKLAEYPVAIPPHSSLLLYSFARRLKPIYEDRYGANAVDPKNGVILVNVAGMTGPLLRVVGHYSPTVGLLSS